MTPIGYQSEAYARALHHGDATPLPHAQSWWIRRQIPGSPLFDGMGTYPLLCCGDWSRLAGDLAALGDEIVSFTAVVDPLGDYDEAMLREAFPDVLYPYKQHYTVDLRQALVEPKGSNHRRNLRKALQMVSVEVCHSPASVANDWINLYANLVSRHNISGYANFSPLSLRQQLEVPGMVVFRAFVSEETLGIQLWLRQGDNAYYHLSAQSGRGYELRSSYALFWYAFHFFQESGAVIANLGSGAGTTTGSKGLSDFKAGWADSQRVAWLGGRILNRDGYRRLTAGLVSAPPYFPQYRAPVAVV